MIPKKIILHKDESDVKSHDDISVIDGWHKDRGFKCTLPNGTVIHVGYHFYVQSNGTVQKGRPINIKGAHCLGYNHESIGICCHGDKHFTKSQMYSVKLLIDEIESNFGHKMEIKGHCELDSRPEKANCPGYDVNQFR